MHNFTAHRLHFITEAQETVELNEHQGSAIRGALFHALRRKFCAFARDRDRECVSADGGACALVQSCPVAILVSTLAPGHRRGRDRPRPYTIQPPLPGSGHPVENPRSGHLNFHYEHGETLEFGLTLYADAMKLFPYVVLAMQEFEQGGLGRRCEQPDGRWRRGTLVVREIWAENPLTGERQPVLRRDSRDVHVPDVPVTHAHVLACRDWDMGDMGHPLRFALSFLTPTRLIYQSRLLKPHTFQFRPFFQRLLERLEALSETFSDTPLDVDFPQLLALAGRARVVDNRLSWEEVRSYSTRRHNDSPTSGLTGTVYLEVPDGAALWPWLLWGQFTHVGKDAVKGNGWYVLRRRRFSDDDDNLK